MTKIEDMTTDDILELYKEKLLIEVSREWFTRTNIYEEIGRGNRAKLIITGPDYFSENSYLHVDLEDLFLHARRTDDWPKHILIAYAEALERIANGLRTKADDAEDHEYGWGEFEYDEGEVIFNAAEGRVVNPPKESTARPPKPPS